MLSSSWSYHETQSGAASEYTALKCPKRVTSKTSAPIDPVSSSRWGLIIPLITLRSCDASSYHLISLLCCPLFLMTECPSRTKPVHSQSRRCKDGGNKICIVPAGAYTACDMQDFSRTISGPLSPSINPEKEHFTPACIYIIDVQDQFLRESAISTMASKGLNRLAQSLNS